MFSCCMLAFIPTLHYTVKSNRLSLQIGYQQFVIPPTDLVSKGTDFILCQLIINLLFC